jgi:hypothetical protein
MIAFDCQRHPHARTRAGYVHGATDTTNLSTDGSWFYFEVVA